MRGSPGCRCKICEPPPDKDQWDDGDRTFVDDVHSFGWHVVDVGSADDLPRWSYTGGLTHTVGGPELVMCGLDGPLMQRCLDMVGRLVRDGLDPADGALVGDVLDGFDVQLRTVAPGWGRALFGHLRWFTQVDEPAVVQVVWPDKDGHFPGDAAFPEGLADRQGQLWLPPGEHPEGPWWAWSLECEWPLAAGARGRVFVDRRVASGGAPIVGVSRDADDDWWFVADDPSWDADDVVPVRLTHVLMGDPTLAPQRSLPPRTTAWRTEVGGPWTYETDDDEDDDED